MTYSNATSILLTLPFSQHQGKSASELTASLQKRKNLLLRRKGKDNASAAEDLTPFQNQAINFQSMYNELSSATTNLDVLERLMADASSKGFVFPHAAKMKRCMTAGVQCLRCGRYAALADFLGMGGFVAEVFGALCADEADRIFESLFQRMVRALPKSATRPSIKYRVMKIMVLGRLCVCLCRSIVHT